MAGRGTGPDFVEALARGLDVLSCFDADQLLARLRAMLESEFDIHHVTLQLESEDCGQEHAGPLRRPAAHGHAH